MITNLLLILAVAFFAFLFWQHRRQSELARAAIIRYCDKLNLQVLSISLMGYKLQLPDGKKRFHAVYQFEFSALGDDYYKGRLIMIGFKSSQFYLPPYRMVDYTLRT